MAIDANDLMTLKALEGGMSPYEQFKVGHMQNRNRISGVGIAGLVTGVAGILTGAAALLWSNAKANGVKDYAEAKHDGLRDIVMTQAQTLAAERQERIAGDVNITNTITDTQSGSQQGTLTQSQQLSNELTFGLMTGRYSENPQRVALYQDAKPCQCPVSCGCGN